MKGLGRAAASAIVAAGLALAGGTASAAVQCVSAGGKVPAGQAKKLGCAATIFTTIGAGVAAAAPGDTVAVFPGTYDEMVTITQSLQLLGQNTKKTIIDATGLTNGVLDSASDVTISGFTIENANQEGIRVAGAAASCAGGPPPVCMPAAPPITNVAILNNIVIDNDKGLDATTLTCPGAADFEQEDCGEGVHLDGVVASTVSGNTVKGNAGGILLTDETNPNSGNLVNANNVENNVPDCGITLPSHPPNGSGANIGALSFGVSDNTIANNTSNANGAAGIGIFTPTPGTSSQGHLVIRNTITNNTQPGVVFHSHAPGQFLSNNSILSNSISGNGSDANPGPGETDGPADPTGIEVYTDKAAAPLFENISGNTINKETNDIWVGATGWANCGAATSPCYNVSAHLNNLLGKSAVGINNAADTTASLVAGSQNFWGCAKGPGQNGCSSATGSVNTTPFLTKTSK